MGWSLNLLKLFSLTVIFYKFSNLLLDGFESI
uniref:Uncharacterized protein n=1 Tax=Siphoviridae sp. ctB3v5 TaxID=2826186 RepID=A0A8S5M9V0_9CAUD|nr:MAG TPA: hypothetical protein [Siphoviridae sp. ctB3v5]